MNFEHKDTSTSECEDIDTNSVYRWRINRLCSAATKHGNKHQSARFYESGVAELKY